MTGNKKDIKWNLNVDLISGLNPFVLRDPLIFITLFPVMWSTDSNDAFVRLLVLHVPEIVC